MADDTAGRIGIQWDASTAAAVIVFGALLFLYLVRRGFRGVVVGV